MKYQIWTILIISFLFAGCGGKSDGFAPMTREISSSISDISAESHMKYGEKSQSGTGWQITIDTADAVENVLLANGWQVEVTYE